MITKEQKQRNIALVRDEMLAMGLDPQCYRCKQFDTEEVACRAGLDFGKYMHGITVCPKLEPNEGEDK